MKTLYLLTIIAGLVCPIMAQQQDTIYRFFKGAVNREYSITMELKQVGTKLEGNYFYDKYRKNVAIKGELRNGNLILLREVDPAGNMSSSIFLGRYTAGWKTIVGTWENQTKDRYFTFDLTAIEEPFGSKRRYDFDHIRWFQEFLNYFDLEPQLPFSVHKGIEKKGFHWKKNMKESAKGDYQKVIPYRLAKRFVMDQVQLKPEGGYNYFQINEKHYKPHEMHYKALCAVYKTNAYVGLLLNFSRDTGWDNYDVTFLLIYDYAGHLLDACKVGKELDLEQEGKHFRESMRSHFLKDSTIETHASFRTVEYGNSLNDEEYFQREDQQRYIYYILQLNGRFIRQEVDLRDKK